MFRGWQKVSYIEYPGNIATVLFTGGCNFRCPYCHNPELVENYSIFPEIRAEEVLQYLEERKGLIDAVCITGGEPLLWKEELLPFLLVQGEKEIQSVREVLREALKFPEKVEFRTTIFPPFHQKETLREMAEEIKSAHTWYWQNFNPFKTLDKEAQKVTPYSFSLLQKWQDEVNREVGKDLVVIRPS